MLPRGPLVIPRPVIWLSVLASLGMTIRGCSYERLRTPRLLISDRIVVAPGEFARTFEGNGLILNDQEKSALAQLRAEWALRPDLQKIFDSNGQPDMVRLMAWGTEVLSDATSTRLLPHRAILVNLESRLGVVGSRPLPEVVVVMLGERGIAITERERVALEKVGEELKTRPEMTPILEPNGMLSLELLFTWAASTAPGKDLSSLRARVAKSKLVDH